MYQDTRIAGSAGALGDLVVLICLKLAYELPNYLSS
jgi:hypothetical protein